MPSFRISNFAICAVFLLTVAGLAQQTPARSRHSSPALRLTHFYDLPNPLPPGHPGQLIRSEPADDYDLPENISALRILYYSRTRNGESVAVSGVVLIPDGNPPPGGWPVLTWAHRPCGRPSTCAPSLLRNLLNGPFLTMYAKLGYAIVATDYAGIGTIHPSPPSDLAAQAYDVIYGVAAARAAHPQLGTRWVALGESTGAVIALAVSDAEGGIHSSGYLGSIAVAIPANPPANLASKPAAAPLFIIAPASPAPEAAAADQLAQGLCAHRVHVQIDHYPVDPSTLLTSTVRDQMAWIQDRVAGRPAPSNCRAH